MLGLVLHQGFGMEAAPYARMARSAPPPAIGLDRYRLPGGTAPDEAQLRVQVMTGEQLQLRTIAHGRSAATFYFVPFTAPPGGAGEGRVLGGMILDKPARDAFVQWAVTKTHPQLANEGVALTVAGLTAPAERVPMAQTALSALRSRGIAVSAHPVFVLPYLGQRQAVLAMEAARVRANPLPRVAYFIAVALLIFAINRYAQHRHENRPEPEPLSQAAVRNTAFERLMQLLAPSAPEPESTPNNLRRISVVKAVPITRRARVMRRLTGLSRFAGFWLGAIGLGWALARIYPNAVGNVAFHAGIAAGPACAVALLVMRTVARRRRAAALAPAAAVKTPASARDGADAPAAVRTRRKSPRASKPDPYEALQKRVAAGEA